MPDIYQIIITVLIGIIGFFLVTKFKKFDKTFDIIKHNIRAMATALFSAKDINFDPSFIKDYSPTALTEEGKDYLEKLGLFKIFNEHSEDFFKIIDADKPKAKFDVENSAMKTILALLDKDYFKSIKTYFYNNPKEDIRGFAKLAGIYVRDKYLEQHKEIDE